MILASASPRRAELLKDEGFQLDICPANIDETRLADETPVEYVERLAREKARQAHEANRDLAAGATLIAADTIVWLPDGRTLGKPADAEDARHMLRELSGRKHHVTTGVCILVDGSPMSGCVAETSFTETTEVEFYPLPDETIEWYLGTGEPFDKAGAYGIQGRGRRLVKGITGDFYNVVGLPVAKLMRTYDKMQKKLADPRSYWF